MNVQTRHDVTAPRCARCNEPVSNLNPRPCSCLDFWATGETTFKQTKRGFRIWLEGSKLAKAGFTRHAKYNRIVYTMGDTDVIFSLSDIPFNAPNTETATYTSSLKVAGRTRRGKDQPIIDFTTTQKLFEPGEKLRVIYKPGRITVFGAA